MARHTQDTFGNHLRRYRLSKLWTLRQLAAMTKVGLSTLSALERDFEQPRPLTLAKIRQALPDFDTAA